MVQIQLTAPQIDKTSDPDQPQSNHNVILTRLVSSIFEHLTTNGKKMILIFS